jgi:hypothetical protein
MPIVKRCVKISDRCSGLLGSLGDLFEATPLFAPWPWV